MASPTFASLKLSPDLLGRIAKAGFRAPSHVQAVAVPRAQTHRSRDVIVRGETGCGKTLAYGLPLLSRVLEAATSAPSASLGGVVVVPTRELAHQVTSVLTPLAAASRKKQQLKKTATKTVSVRRVVGTATTRMKDSLLADVPHVVVGTPHVLSELVPRVLGLGAVQTMVFDEIDHLASPNSNPHVTKLLEAVTGMRHRPQTWFVGATTSPASDALVDKYLRHPTVVDLTDDGKALLPSVISHYVATCVAESQRFAHVPRLLAKFKPKRALVFVSSAAEAEALETYLTTKKRVRAGAFLPHYYNAVRQGKLQDFARGRLQVLVCVDGSSRGLDMAGVELVVNVQPPKTLTDYVHRAGRVGRLKKQKNAGSSSSSSSPSPLLLQGHVGGDRSNITANVVTLVGKARDGGDGGGGDDDDDDEEETVGGRAVVETGVDVGARLGVTIHELEV